MKKTRKKTTQPKNERKLDLFGSVLPNLDRRNFEYYQGLDEEQKKEYVPYILMRWLSQAPNQHGIAQYYLKQVNIQANHHFWDLSKHVDLQHRLLASCGIGDKVRHSWIGMPKKLSQASALDKFVLDIFPSFNYQELKIFYNSYDLDSFEEFLKEFGLEKDEVKKYLKEFSERDNSNQGQKKDEDE